MTSAQARILRYARRGAAIKDGDYVDCSLMTGWNGAALEAVIRSCQKRGWLDDRGAITDDGRKQLEAPPACSHEWEPHPGGRSTPVCRKCQAVNS